ncbi:MAG: type VI secretion system ATPase TssH, partial [Saprospiraceae bacterium]|nr:type VI secretion system ATPase TssH [Saprospiraceae bacterium]
MTYDNFTIKAQESILKAQQIAAGMDQQQVDTTHLIRGIIETDENVAKFLLQKTGVNMASLNRNLDEAIRTYPKVEGSEKQYLTKDANKALSRAKKLMPDFGDEYISIELILLGILTGDDKGGKILKTEGVTEKELK